MVCYNNCGMTDPYPTAKGQYICLSCGSSIVKNIPTIESLKEKLLDLKAKIEVYNDELRMVENELFLRENAECGVYKPDDTLFCDCLNASIVGNPNNDTCIGCGKKINQNQNRSTKWR